MSEVIEQESTELVTLPPKESALVVYSNVGGLDPLIEQIRAKVAGTVYDMATAKGRDECRSDAAKVARSKTAIEKLGKALSAEYKEIPKKIDAERKRAFDELEALQKQVRQPLTEWEEAEEARVDYHKRMIQHIKNCALGLIGGQPQPYAILFRELEEKIVIDGKWEEFEAEAHRAKAEALAGLKVAFAEQQKRDAEQAELTRLRAESEARAKLDEERRIAKEAAEAATKAAEAKAQAERDAAAKAAAERRELELKLQAETAEREKLEAVQKAEREKAEAAQRAEQERKDAEERQRQAVEAERKRQADEAARIEAETKAREANKAHKAKINNAAMAAFIAEGLTAECAKLAVVLVASGKIPAIKINY